MRLIGEMLDGDELSNAFLSNYKYLKNYMESPAQFPPEGNRILFWNKEQIVTGVIEYNDKFIKHIYT